MLGLHKGWLAFGVELDSFCERETNPQNSNVSNVGMASLIQSKLYGRSLNAQNASCTCTVSGTPTLTPSGCSNNSPNNTCTGCTCSAGVATFTAYRPSITNFPGKHNFIGFGDDNCSVQDLTNRQVLGEEGGTTTTQDTDCDLNISSYEMGVYGHISGDAYFGVSINDDGVVSGETEKSTGVATADATCA